VSLAKATKHCACRIGRYRPRTSCASSPARQAEPRSRGGSPSSLQRHAARSSHRPHGCTWTLPR
jgi:hypothetical protein